MYEIANNLFSICDHHMQEIYLNSFVAKQRVTSVINRNAVFIPLHWWFIHNRKRQQETEHCPSEMCFHCLKYLNSLDRSIRLIRV
jgi:hypothetical protein